MKLVGSPHFELEGESPVVMGIILTDHLPDPERFSYSVLDKGYLRPSRIRPKFLFTMENKDGPLIRLLVIKRKYTRVGTKQRGRLNIVLSAALKNIYPELGTVKSRKENIVIFITRDMRFLHEYQGNFLMPPKVIDNPPSAFKLLKRVSNILSWFRAQSTFQLKKFVTPTHRTFFSEYVANAEIPLTTLQSKFQELVQKLKTGRKLELEDIRSNMPTITSVVQ